MRNVFPIRQWRRVGLCALLAVSPCLSASGQTLTAPTKSTQSSAAQPPSHHSSQAQTTGPSHHASSHHTSSQRTSSQSGTKTSTSPAKKGSRRVGSKKKNARTAKTAKKRGQQAIDPTRAREIQEALIREHYLQGEPSGSWDSATQAAMQKYQADQGWQAKTTPDSRALIKLGLGPSHDHLLNPESAMTTAPATADPKPGPKQPSADDDSPKQ